MKRLSLLGLVAVVACAEALAPRTLCGCTIASPGAFVSGVLAAADGRPVEGARVQFVVWTLPDTINRISRSTLTDSGGRFGLFALGATEGSRWVHLFVHDTASGRITRPAPESLLVRFRYSPPFDTVRATLAYRP